MSTGTARAPDDFDTIEGVERAAAATGEHERALFAAIADSLGGERAGWDVARVAAISAAQGSPEIGRAHV